MNNCCQTCILLYPFMNTTTGFCNGRWPYIEKLAYFAISFAAVSVAELYRHLPDKLPV